MLDKDTLTADEDLGSILLAVEDLTDGKQHELDIQLEGPQQPPSIQLRVQYLTLSGDCTPCWLSVAAAQNFSVSTVVARSWQRPASWRCRRKAPGI